jgi:hypothetical protein
MRTASSVRRDVAAPLAAARDSRSPDNPVSASIRRVNPPQVAPRECGACTACCTAEGVHELHKLPGDACQFVCSKGCGIYEKRPESCRGFSCLWLEGVFELEARPDTLEVVFSMAPAPVKMHPWRRYIRVMEVVPGAASRPACLELIRWLTSKGEIVWVYTAEACRTGGDVQIHYPDGKSIVIHSGFTFEQQLAQIEAMQNGATPKQAQERFPANPTPPPRLAVEWMSDREARRVIQRGKPIRAVQRLFESLRDAEQARKK